METVPPSKFATAISSLPSPSMSPAATSVGRTPVRKSICPAKEEPLKAAGSTGKVTEKGWSAYPVIYKEGAVTATGALEAPDGTATVIVVSVTDKGCVIAPPKYTTSF